MANPNVTLELGQDSDMALCLAFEIDGEVCTLSKADSGRLELYCDGNFSGKEKQCDSK